MTSSCHVFLTPPWCISAGAPSSVIQKAAPGAVSSANPDYASYEQPSGGGAGDVDVSAILGDVNNAFSE